MGMKGKRGRRGKQERGGGMRRVWETGGGVQDEML
jgi:hypothetical protein